MKGLEKERQQKIQQYERGQRFKDEYGEFILLNEYADGIWEVRRWSGFRHVGDVVMNERGLTKAERIN